jgi:hypothetical protein
LIVVAPPTPELNPAGFVGRGLIGEEGVEEELDFRALLPNNHFGIIYLLVLVI